MKKVWILAVCLLMGTAMAKADERPISNDQLPKNAQKFIKKHFPKEKDLAYFEDRGLFATDYEVKSGSMELEFDSEGEWKKVDCKYAAVPADIVPKNVVAEAGKYFPNVPIVKIKKDRRGYDIKLANGHEMEFDAKGGLVDIDD